MKKLGIVTMLLVLTAALLAGCGCTNPDMAPSSAPTILPTNGEVVPTTRPATTPTTAHTAPSGTTQPTIDHGNGPLDDTATSTTGAATDTTDTTETQTRMMPWNR